MSERPTPADPLERWVQRTLSELPSLTAPASLEARVQAELSRRAALPWWRQSFAQWPMAARVGFVVLCAAVMTLMALLIRTHDVSALPIAWAKDMNATVISASGFVALILRNIPTSWLLIALGVGSLYTMLFGLGAIAYRTLYLQPSTAGDRS
jgi:hypothetical protein